MSLKERKNAVSPWKASATSSHKPSPQAQGEALRVPCWRLELSLFTRQGTTQLPGRIAHPQGLSFMFPGVSPLVVAWHCDINLRFLISWLLWTFCCLPINLFSQSANVFAPEWEVYHIVAFLPGFSPASEVIFIF